MVTYEEFKELIREKAEEETGNHVVVNKIHKNNGLMLDGLVIMAMDTNVSPTIYLHSFYEKYKERMDIEEDPIQVIWEDIYELYKKHLPESWFNAENYKNFEFIEDKIRIKLVNYEKNEEWLKEIAYVPFLDLAMVFYVWMDTGWGEFGSIVVHKEHMEIWGKTETELMEIAMRNIKDDYEINSIGKVLADNIGETYHDIESVDLDEFTSMFILSNKMRVHGASAILCDGVLRQFANEHRCDKVIILPSSIHETLLIPMDAEGDAEYFNYMVREVNETSLAEEEILSDHAYLYYKDSNEIKMK